MIIGLKARIQSTVSWLLDILLRKQGDIFMVRLNNASMRRFLFAERGWEIHVGIVLDQSVIEWGTVHFSNLNYSQPFSNRKVKLVPNNPIGISPKLNLNTMPWLIFPRGGVRIQIVLPGQSCDSSNPKLLFSSIAFIERKLLYQNSGIASNSDLKIYPHLCN